MNGWADSISRPCAARIAAVVCGRKRKKMPKWKHGHTNPETPTYASWYNMRQRCEKPNAVGYHLWGGRGIKVCERWQDFRNFLTDMGEKPKGKTLDRIDNDGNYEPGNCRWATYHEQLQNTRLTRRLTFNGETKTLYDWSKTLGIKCKTLSSRFERGWSPEEILRTEVAKYTKTHPKWNKEAERAK